MKPVFEESRTRLLPHSNCFIPFWARLIACKKSKAWQFSRVHNQSTVERVVQHRLLLTKSKILYVHKDALGKQKLTLLATNCTTVWFCSYPLTGLTTSTNLRTCWTYGPNRQIDLLVRRTQSTYGGALAYKIEDFVRKTSAPNRTTPAIDREYSLPSFSLKVTRCCFATSVGHVVTPRIASVADKSTQNRRFGTGCRFVNSTVARSPIGCLQRLRYYNRVAFKIVLENTGVKWDYGVSRSHSRFARVLPLASSTGGISCVQSLRFCKPDAKAVLLQDTNPYSRGNHLISFLGMNFNSIAYKIFNFVRGATAPEIELPFVREPLPFDTFPSFERYRKVAERDHLWRGRCSSGLLLQILLYKTRPAVGANVLLPLASQTQAARFKQSIGVEPIVVARTIIDTYSSVVNTFQWYVQVPMDDQAIVQSLPFEEKGLQNKPVDRGKCLDLVSNQLINCSFRSPLIRQPLSRWASLTAGFVMDTTACRRERADNCSPDETVNHNPEASFLLSCSRWNIVTRARYKTIRPLLNLSRESLTTLCKHLWLPVYPDKSNKVVQYSRNRLREQILPAVQMFLNPKVEEALFKLAELLTQDFSTISRLVKSKRRVKL